MLINRLVGKIKRHFATLPDFFKENVGCVRRGFLRRNAPFSINHKQQAENTKKFIVAQKIM